MTLPTGAIYDDDFIQRVLSTLDDFALDDFSLWLEHTTPLFLALNKHKIRDIYTYQLAIHMYRFYHDLLPPDLPNVTFTTQSEIHNYNTRQVLNLHIAPTNTQLAKNTIKTQGPLIWNTLNTHIKNFCFS